MAFVLQGSIDWETLPLVIADIPLTSDGVAWSFTSTLNRSYQGSVTLSGAVGNYECDFSETLNGPSIAPASHVGKKTKWYQRIEGSSTFLEPLQTYYLRVRRITGASGQTPDLEVLVHFDTVPNQVLPLATTSWYTWSWTWRTQDSPDYLAQPLYSNISHRLYGDIIVSPTTNTGQSDPSVPRDLWLSKTPGGTSLKTITGKASDNGVNVFRWTKSPTDATADRYYLQPNTQYYINIRQQGSTGQILDTIVSGLANVYELQTGAADQTYFVPIRIYGGAVPQWSVKTYDYLIDWNLEFKEDIEFSLGSYEGFQNPAIKFVTPTNPDFSAVVTLLTAHGTQTTPIQGHGLDKMWIAEYPGGPPIAEWKDAGFATTWDLAGGPNSLQGYQLTPSTTYYIHCAPAVLGPTGFYSTWRRTLNMRIFGEPYVSEPPIPPPPEPPEPPPPPPPEPPQPPEDPEDPPVVPPVVEEPPLVEPPTTPPPSLAPEPIEPTVTATPAGTAVSKIVNNVGVAIGDAIYPEIQGGIPEPLAEVNALFKTVHAMKIAFEQLTRGRGDKKKSAVLVTEIEDILAATIRVTDKRYAPAQEFEPVEGDTPMVSATAPAGQPATAVYDASFLAASLASNASALNLQAHLKNTAIHMTDAPVSGTWGRQRGTWVRSVGFDDMQQYVASVTATVTVANTGGMDNLKDDLSPQLGGELDINGQGFTARLVAAEDIALGEVCYMDASGQVSLADATTEATARTMIVLALSAVALGGSGQFLLWGYYPLLGVTSGDVIYLSTTPGIVGNIAPTGSAEVVRVIGYATATDQIFLSPDKTWMVLV